MSTDLGAQYRAARIRITDLLSDDLADTPVPATPMWNVHDLLAHLAGTTEDVRDGNLEGVATDAWTAAQVERGRDKSVSELLAVWTENAPLLETFLSSPDGMAAFRAVLDVHTHEADLLNALDQPVVLPDEFLGWVSRRLIRDFDHQVADAGLDPVVVDASSLEVFRGRFGRRTAAEVCTYGWSADPEPYLDTWFVFGRAETSLGERTT